MEIRSKQDALISNIIIGIGILVFLVSVIGHGILIALITAIIVSFLLFTAWCMFFRAPTTSLRIILGIVCIPLYLWYAAYVWVAFAKQSPLTP